MVESNTNQFVSINLSSTCIAVLLFGLDVLCVFPRSRVCAAFPFVQLSGWLLALLSGSGSTFIINSERLSGRSPLFFLLINVFVLRQY
jgi:hypothetical protein